MFRAGITIPVLLVLAAIAGVVLGIASVIGGPDSVRGQVVSVESASVTTLSRLTIEDESGKLWTFTGTGIFSGFTSSHLEEHRTLREAVTVEFETLEGGELSILGIVD